MRKQKPPGQTPPQGTSKDPKKAEGRGPPSGTRLGRGVVSPPPRSRPSRRTMMGGVPIIVEPAADTTSPVQPSEEQKDQVEELEEGCHRGELLGKGGMGEVYKGVWIKKMFGKPVIKQVAIKVLKLDEKELRPQIEKQVRKRIGNQIDQEKLDKLVTEEMERIRKGMNERFITECQVIANLHHKNIIGIVDVGVEEDPKTGREEPFYAMEYLEGIELERMVVKGGPIPWERASHLMLETCKALEAAHNNKDKKTGEPEPIVHRDIKPANIIVITDSDGTQNVKVLDFGIAKIVAPTVEGPTHGEGMVIGTPGYLAPEQVFGGTIDNRTDIYGVGSTMYHVLTGHTVFSGNSDIELLTKTIYEKPVSMRESNPDLNIPEETDEIVMKCLERDPAKRYQSMKELIDAINRNMSTMNITRLRSGDILQPPDGLLPEGGAQDIHAAMTVKDGEIISADFARRRRKIIGGVVAAAFLATMTTAGVFLMRGPKKEESARKPAVVSPMAEPIRRDAGTVMAAAPRIDAGVPKKKERTVTFRTKPTLKGVRVFSGKKLLCTTAGDGTCSITLQKGKALKVTFKRRGYKNKTMTVFKDSSGSLPVTLERKHKRHRRRRRRKDPMITSEG